jgi:ABC-type glycerol-3-phosphate transport system permease component
MVSKAILAGIILIFIVVAVIAAIIYSLSKASSPTNPVNSTPPITITPQNTTPKNGQTSIQCPPINSSGGTGASFLSKAQAESLFGSSPYVDYCPYIISQQNMSQYLHLTLTNDTSRFENNISIGWYVGYNVYSSTNQSEPVLNAAEAVFKTPQAGKLYESNIARLTDNGTKALPQGTILNATLDNMTYTYSQNNIGFNATEIVGFKNNQITTMVILGKVVNQTELASAVAGDMS